MPSATQTTDPIRIVAALIVDEQGRALLVRKYGTDVFMQPGGKPEPGETPSETLAREIREELGCEIRPDTIERQGLFRAKAANEPGREVYADVYRVALSGPPVAKAEIAELIWIAADNPCGLRLAPLTKDCVLPLI